MSRGEAPVSVKEATTVPMGLKVLACLAGSGRFGETSVRIEGSRGYATNGRIAGMAILGAVPDGHWDSSAVLNSELIGVPSWRSPRLQQCIEDLGKRPWAAQSQTTKTALLRSCKGLSEPVTLGFSTNGSVGWEPSHLRKSLRFWQGPITVSTNQQLLRLSNSELQIFVSPAVRP